MPSIENPAMFIGGVVAAARQPLRRSMVLVEFRVLGCWPDTYLRTGSAMLADLYLTCDDRLAGDYLATTPILSRALQFCQHHRPDAIAVIIIDDPQPNRPVPRAAHRELVTLLGDRLADHAIPQLDAWILAGTTTGQRWESLLDGDSGNPARSHR